MVDDAVELLRRSIRPVSLGPTFSPSAAPRCLRTASGDRGEPQLRPRQRGRREERQRLPAEDLVADRLVEQIAGGQTCRPRLALVEDALGLEEQCLPESLGPDDDELVIPVGAQEVVDLGRPVEQGLVEVLRHADVVGVHGPRSHAFPPRLAGGHEDSPSTRTRPAGAGTVAQARRRPVGSAGRLSILPGAARTSPRRIHDRCYDPGRMMNRRAFLRAVSLSLLAAPLVAEAQPAAKVARIAYLSLQRERRSKAGSRHFGKDSKNWDTWRAATSPSSSAMRGAL